MSTEILIMDLTLPLEYLSKTNSYYRNEHGSYSDKMDNESDDFSSCDCNQSCISQITLDDEISDDYFRSSNVHQPSLAPTFNSDDESDSFEPNKRAQKA